MVFYFHLAKLNFERSLLTSDVQLSFVRLVCELYTENEYKIHYSNPTWFYTCPHCTTPCGAVAQYSKGFRQNTEGALYSDLLLDPEEFKPLFLPQPKAVAMVQYLCCSQVTASEFLSGNF